MSFKYIATAAVLLMMVAVPFSTMCADADAEGNWWDTTTEIDIEAGSTFQYSSIKAPNGEAVMSITVESDLVDYIMVDGNSIRAALPMSLEAGDYDVVLLVTTKSSTYWMRFIFHVTEKEYGEGFAANLPVINNIDVTNIGNNVKVASVNINMTNVTSMVVDYGDNISTEPISIDGPSMTVTHKYDQTGLFAMKITTSNAYGSVQNYLVYDSGTGKVVEYGMEVDDGSDNHPAWILYALAGVTVILLGAFLIMRVPIALFGAIVAGVATVVDYLFII